MDDAELAMALAALGSPTRLALFRRLVEAGPSGLGPTILAEMEGLPRNLVSYHLKPLGGAGLVRSGRSGRDMLYTVDSARFGAFTLAVQKLVLLKR